MQDHGLILFETEITGQVLGEKIQGLDPFGEDHQAVFGISAGPVKTMKRVLDDGKELLIFAEVFRPHGLKGIGQRL